MVQEHPQGRVDGEVDVGEVTAPERWLPIFSAEGVYEGVPERWLPVLRYEGFYEVSDLGRVRSVTRATVRKNGHTYYIKERILKCTPRKDGYTRVAFSREGVVYTTRVHTVVLEAFVGLRPAKMECLHDNGNHADNRLINLSWGTPTENALDKVRHGTHHYSRRKHCKFNHKLEGPNLRLRTDSGRRCFACMRAKSAQRRATGPFDFRAVANEHYDKIMAAA